jgi:transcriptional regulator with XRE-family HTH domain
MYGTPHMVSSTSQRSITESTSREPYTVTITAVEARRRGLRLSVVLDDPTRKARLAYAIRSARDRRGLTPPQLADRLHVGRGTVNKWESGEQVPNLLMLGPLCEALGVDANLFAVLPPIPAWEGERYLEEMSLETDVRLAAELEQSQRTPESQADDPTDGPTDGSPGSRQLKRT